MTGGHEVVVFHDGEGPTCKLVCHEPLGADCRLICAEGCDDWHDVTRDGDAATSHGVYGHDGSLTGRHRLIDAGRCQAIKNIKLGIGRFPIRPVLAGDGYEWQYRVLSAWSND